MGPYAYLFHLSKLEHVNCDSVWTMFYCMKPLEIESVYNLGHLRQID